MNNFSENLAKIMHERKITQTSLAEGTCISQAAISRYIKALASPGAKELHSIATYLGVSMDFLWTGLNYTDSDNPSPSIKPAPSEPPPSDSARELAELKRSLRIVFRAMSEPEPHPTFSK